MSFTNRIYSRKPSICLKPAPVTSFKYSYVYQDVEDVALFRLVNPLKQRWALFNDSQEFTMNVCVFFNIKMQRRKETYISNNKTSKNGIRRSVKNGQGKDKSNWQQETALPIRALAHAQLCVYECENCTCMTENDAEHATIPTTEQWEDNHNNMSHACSDNKQSQTKQSCSHCESGKQRETELHVRSHYEREANTSSVGHTLVKSVKPLYKKVLTTVTVKVSTSVKPHETVLFIEYDNPIDVEGAVMQIDVTLSECELQMAEFVGGWRRSDNAFILKPELSVMPSYTNVYRCFPENKVELLYRLVDRESNIWAFFNDTVDYKITVKMELDAESVGVTPLDHTLVRCNDSQLFDRESTPEQSLLTLFSLPNEISQETVYATNRNQTFTSCLNGSTTSTINTAVANVANSYVFKNKNNSHCTNQESNNKLSEPLKVPLGQTQLHFQRQLYTEVCEEEQEHEEKEELREEHPNENGEMLAALSDSKEQLYSFPPLAKPGATALSKERIFELTLLPLTTERFLQGVPVNYVISFAAEPLHNENAQYERIPFVNGAPDYTVIDYDQLYSCFNKEQHQGMLFRLVDTLNRCWGFYNDTTQYEFTVECKFPSLTLADVCDAGPETRVQFMPVKEMEQERLSQSRSGHKLYMENEHANIVSNTNSSEPEKMHMKRFCGKEANKEGVLEHTESVINETSHKYTNGVVNTNTYYETRAQETHNCITDTSCAVVFTLLIPPCSSRLFLSGGLPQEYSLQFIGKLIETDDKNKPVASTTSKDEANGKNEVQQFKLNSSCTHHHKYKHHGINISNDNNGSCSSIRIKKEKNSTWTIRSEDVNHPHQEENNKQAKIKNTTHVPSFKLIGPQKSIFDYQRILPCVVDCNDHYAFHLIDSSSGEFDQWGFYNDMKEFDLIVTAKFVDKHDIFGNDLGPPIIPVNKKEVKLIKIVPRCHKSTNTDEHKHIKSNSRQECNKWRELQSLNQRHSYTDTNDCREDNNNDTIDGEFHLLNESFSAPVMPFYKPKQRLSRASLHATPSLSREQLSDISPLSASSLSLSSENVTGWEAFVKKKPSRAEEQVREQEIGRDMIDSTWHHTDSNQNQYTSRWTTTFTSVSNKNKKLYSKRQSNDSNNCRTSKEMQERELNNEATYIDRRQTWTAVITVVKPGETKSFVKFKHLVPVSDYTLRYHTRLCSENTVKVEHTEALVRGTHELKLRYDSIFSSVGKVADVGGDDHDGVGDSGDDILKNKLFRLVHNYELDDLDEQEEEHHGWKQEKNSNVIHSLECHNKISKSKSSKEVVDSSTNTLYDNVISVEDEWKLHASHVDWSLYNDSPDMCYIVSVKFNDKSKIKPLSSTHVRKAAFTSTNTNIVQSVVESMTLCNARDNNNNNNNKDNTNNNSKSEVECNWTNDKTEQFVFSSTVLPLQTVPFLTGYIVGEYRITIRADAVPENETINFVNGLPRLEYKAVNEIPTSETNNSRVAILSANNQLSDTNVNSCRLPLLKHTKKSFQQQQQQLEHKEEEKKNELINVLSQQLLRVYRVFSKSANGLLFRIVDDARQCWWFYNDTKHVTFKVQATFYANSSFQVAGNAVLTSQPDKCNNNIYFGINNNRRTSFNSKTDDDVSVTVDDYATSKVKSERRHHERLPHVHILKEKRQ